MSKFDPKSLRGSVPIVQSKFLMRDAIRWFKCKLKPPKKKVEFIFCSALADATPKQLVSYLKYWMGDQGIPLIEKWECTGKLDYSNADETPATEGGRRRVLSSGNKIQAYWDLLDEEFKPKGNKVLSIIEL